MADEIPHDVAHTRLQDKGLLDLMENHVDPAIRRVVRSKLHATLWANDDRSENEDALDLVSEIRAVTIRAITRNGKDNNIENVVSYACRIAANVCNEYFRERYPRYFRLKNGVRYILTHDSRFALWKTTDGSWLCGKKSWAGRTGSGETIDLPAELRDQVDPATISPDNFNLIDLVATAVDVLSAPVPSTTIVKAIYEILEIDESTEEFSDQGRRIAYSESGSAPLERKQLIESIWAEMAELPPRHRAAVLLNLRNERGDSAIEFLPLLRIASIRQIAAALEIPADEFAKIWGELPWDDNRIAEHLGITRQQVINLRQSARTKLKRRLAGS